MKLLKLTLACLVWTTGWGQAASADQATDEASVRAAVDAYVVAYNNRDSKALAAMWSPDAIYTNPISGDQVAGREAIEQQFAQIFTENQDAKLTAATESVQFISPGVALERGTAQVVQPEREPEETEYTAVYVKRDGAWLLDRVSEEELPRVDSQQNRLKELEWMIGKWVDEDDEARVETSCQWTKNRNFITQMFSLVVEGQIEHSGMQVIGWDPTEETIRSWVFDSSGGFGEGLWTQKDQAWYIQAIGTLPDGSKSSSTNIVTSVDNNTFTWQSNNRIVDGELLPNVDEVMVVRKEGE